MCGLAMRAVSHTQLKISERSGWTVIFRISFVSTLRISRFFRATGKSALAPNRLALYVPPEVKLNFSQDSSELCSMVHYAIPSIPREMTWPGVVQRSDLKQQAEMIARAIELLRDLHKEGLCLAHPDAANGGHGIFVMGVSQLVLDSEDTVFTTIDPKFQVNLDKQHSASQSTVATEKDVNRAAQDMISLANTLETADQSGKLHDKVLGVVAEMKAAMVEIAAKEGSPNYDEWIGKLKGLSK